MLWIVGDHNVLWIAQASATDGSLPGSGDRTATGKLSASGSQGFAALASDRAALSYV